MNIALGNGSSLAVNMLTGSYLYTPPSTITTAIALSIGFTLMDNDGDPASANLSIAISGGNQPLVIRDDLVLSNVATQSGSDVIDIPRWALLADRTFRHPWFVAGGLTPENVGQAIQRTGARQVDVSSGVESAPGVKDAARIAADRPGLVDLLQREHRVVLAGPTQTVVEDLRSTNGVLVNGKRRHNTALINNLARIGTAAVPVNLDLIPVSAIDHIEVLRDGASAQYGSDAIAGVIKGGAGTADNHAVSLRPQRLPKHHVGQQERQSTLGHAAELLARFYGCSRLAGQKGQVANVHIRISKRAKIK